MRTRKLYAIFVALNGTTNDAVHIDFPQATVVRAVSILLNNQTAMANGAYVRAELAWSSTNQMTINDSLAVLAEANQGVNLTTSGSINVTAHIIQGLQIQVKALDRLYLHLLTGQAATGYVSALVYCD